MRFFFFGSVFLGHIFIYIFGHRFVRVGYFVWLVLVFFWGVYFCLGR